MMVLVSMDEQQKLEKYPVLQPLSKIVTNRGWFLQEENGIIPRRATGVRVLRYENIAWRTCLTAFLGLSIPVTVVSTNIFLNTEGAHETFRTAFTAICCILTEFGIENLQRHVRT
jgi:hypothetical protein